MAIFHGGTSLALIRGSPRFSEDLDFMVDERATSRLGATMQKLRAKLDLAMSLHYPDGVVALKGPRGKEVVTWQVVWSHPARRNTVMVKVEFFVTRAGALEAYRATHELPSTKGVVAVTTPIPVPELVSAWADKIKAVATRGELKWRDAYDLWWIARRLGGQEDLSDQDRLEALEVSAGLYGKTLEDVGRGLGAVVASGALTDVSSFEADMSRWFPPSLFSRYREAGLFGEALASATREIERARALIVAGTA
ncbi:MAG: nucleotidyl transferase AbiEii/AbiGii toxin family protein [Labilithrix sp.]|nr:nucleotidyl transferase AbiEii/AbiGii toxin family protein [Labilithrix sp.]MCW5815065.1 nucleotidyl transferase AbiEii/AbiGii toxin family protein [Labilithrix sp.]